jgi:hypothetical protein
MTTRFDIPASNEALHYARRYGQLVEDSLRAGQIPPKPGIPNGMDPDDALRGLARYFHISSYITEPTEILAEVVRSVGDPMVEILAEREMALRVVDRRRAYAELAPAGLEALTPDQMDIMSRALAEGRVPTDLLSDRSLPTSVREAILAATPDSAFADEITWEDRYGARETSETGSDSAGEPTSDEGGTE